MFSIILNGCGLWVHNFVRKGELESGRQLISPLHFKVNIATDLAVRLGLRGADSFYVAVAQKLNLPLATLDGDQQNRAEVIVKVLDIP